MALKIGEVALALIGAVIVFGGIKVFNLCIIQAISWGLL